MNAFGLAWRCWIRQPARAWLGVVGVAAVGALLFDMLLLSRGLLISFTDALDAMRFDVRITATDALPGTGPEIPDGPRLTERLLALDAVDSAMPMRFSFAELHTDDDGTWLETVFFGADAGDLAPWQILEGEGLPVRGRPSAGTALVNRFTARVLDLSVGDTVRLRGRCENSGRAVPLRPFVVAGIARFPFDAADSFNVGVRLDDLQRVCGDAGYDGVDMILVASAASVSSEEAIASIQELRDDLHLFSNSQFLTTFETNDFSYFRQISFVLATVTLFFAFLLITSLLTVSTNQRLGEIAALRAMGFGRRRIVADLLWESVLFVGTGGLLAIPLGLLLAGWLDRILKRMPGFPESLHFFVFHAEAVRNFVLLLIAAGLVASAYPVWLATRLPIADTLRREVT